MKDTINCPYCQAEERGYSENWGMSPDYWEELKRIHDEQHCEEYPVCTIPEWQTFTGEIWMSEQS